MRKALVIGINHYEHVSSLFGCVNDAQSIKNVIERNADGSPNFQVKLCTAATAADPVRRSDLKDLVAELFADDNECAFFYFAGHGHIEATGGYLLASDCRRGDDGLPLGEVLALANGSRALSKVVVLDSCHSGVAGTLSNDPRMAVLSDGLTILTASTAEQYASEEDGAGVFTALFVDALNGSAANLVGDITPGSIYAHVDQSLGAWEQRPVFKTNVKRFVSLRKVQPPLSLLDLRRITALFPAKNFLFQLDPTFEPETRGRGAAAPPPVPANTASFAVLQAYNRVGLVVPEGAPHMWHAAIESKACKLTPLGEHYRRLVAQGRI